MKGKLLTLLGSNIVRVAKGTIRFTKHNSNWILSALAILGITGLTWTTIRGTIKAVKLCEEKQVQGNKEIIKTTWRLYIPAAGFFLLTTLSIISNARINARRLAAMTSLVAMTQADIKNLRDKVKEMVGPKKEQSIETEIEKDKVRALGSFTEDEIIKTGHGNDLFIDWLTGQKFRASADYIDLVATKLNTAIKEDMTNVIQRSFIHDMLHLPNCGCGELYWDLPEMERIGYHEISLNCTHTEWVEVNGKREMACTMRCIPEATGF